MKPRIYGIKNCDTIKRPILEAGSKLLVGFDAAEYEAKL